VFIQPLEVNVSARTNLDNCVCLMVWCALRRVDSQRPCKRCVAAGRADLCVDPELRKKGRRSRSAKTDAAGGGGTTVWDTSALVAASPPLTKRQRIEGWSPPSPSRLVLSLRLASHTRIFPPVQSQLEQVASPLDSLLTLRLRCRLFYLRRSLCPPSIPAVNLPTSPSQAVAT
jgi:hypothetical protein